MHILLIELALSGHRSGYLQHVAESYVKRGHAVTIAVPSSLIVHPAVDLLTRSYGSLVHLFPIDEDDVCNARQARSGQVGIEISYRQMFQKTFRIVNSMNSVDMVFLPYLDYCLYAIGLLGSPFGKTPWCGICMRPSFHYQKMGIKAPLPKFSPALRRIFLRVLLNPYLVALFSIDELLCSFWEKRSQNENRKLRYLADPAEFIGNETYLSSRGALGIVDRKVILVYGTIDKRKRLEVLLDLCSKYANLNRYLLLVVGRQSLEISDLLKKGPASSLLKRNALIIFNEFATAKFEQLAFAAADFVWLGYRGHFTMSGVLALSAVARKKVIATDEGLIGWFTENYKLGYLVDVSSESQILDLLVTLLQDEPRAEAYCSNSNFVEKFSWNEFESTIGKALPLPAQP